MLSIHQINLKKIYSAVFNIIIIIIHVFWAVNQNIKMISEGSCDWSNDANKITGINYIWKYIQIENIYFK